MAYSEMGCDWNMAGYENKIMKSNDFICRYKSDDFAYWNCNYICREAFLSRQQARLLTYLQERKWLPVFRLIVLYKTSHIHVQEYKKIFYICSEMDSEEEIRESEENLKYLFQLGLLKVHFRLRTGCICIISWNRVMFFKHFIQNIKAFRIHVLLWKEVRLCFQKWERRQY